MQHFWLSKPTDVIGKTHSWGISWKATEFVLECLPRSSHFTAT